MNYFEICYSVLAVLLVIWILQSFGMLKRKKKLDPNRYNYKDLAVSRREKSFLEQAREVKEEKQIKTSERKDMYSKGMTQSQVSNEMARRENRTV